MIEILDIRSTSVPDLVGQQNRFRAQSEAMDLRIFFAQRGKFCRRHGKGRCADCPACPSGTSIAKP
jgi:hypothetical protein